jgi:hypothetical protein
MAVMVLQEQMFLALVVAAFTAFGVVLAYASRIRR